MSELPAGRITFLFTDIEGSTSILRRLEARYPAVLGRHREIIRAAISRNRGVEVRTEGDSFFVAFDDASDAVVAAVEAQRALIDEPWAPDERIMVRMGLHTGDGVPMAGDYLTIAVHQAARVQSAAHGGQILVTDEVLDACRSRLPSGVSARSLGPHALKDFPTPIALHQLRHDGLPSDFPPLRSLSVLAHNLPIQTSSFIGRTHELSEVTKALETSRLVTLTGAGGTGKTRLALESATEAMDQFPDGIWLTGLGPLRDPGEVAGELAHVLGVEQQSDTDTATSLVAALRPKRALLVIDNCEHVVDATASLVDTIMRGCPEIHVLATSRMPLGVTGEQTYRVLPLDVPPTTDDLLDFDAARLFVERLSGHRRVDGLADDDLAAIVSICVRTDGIPLGLELAAARGRHLALPDLATRLGKRFDVIGEKRGTDQPHHLTLRSLIDWSYDLLDEPERVLYRRLGVFVGGFTTTAAEEVVADDILHVDDVLEPLTALIDHSLVEVDLNTGRCRMLESIREHALAHLAAAGEELKVRTSHAAWSRRLLADASQRYFGPDERDGVDLIDRDHENVLQAVRHLTTAAPKDAAQMTRQLSRFWTVRGYWSVARAQLSAVLDELTEPSVERAAVLVALARITSDTVGPANARTMYEEARAICAGHVDADVLAAAIGGIGLTFEAQSDFPSARSFVQQALDICRTDDDRPGIVQWMGSLGRIARSLGELEDARSIFEETLDLTRKMGYRAGLAIQMTSLGVIMADLADLDDAQRLLDEALEISHELGTRSTTASLYGHLGIVAERRGDYASARTFYLDAIAISRDLGNLSGVASWTGTLGRALQMLSEYDESRERYLEAKSISASIGDLQEVAFAAGNLGDLARSLGRHAEARTHYEEAIEICRRIGDRSGEFSWLSNLGMVALVAESAEVARRLIEEAGPIAREIGFKSGIAYNAFMYGTLLYRLNEWDASKARYEESLAIYTETGQRPFIGHCSLQLAGIALAQARLDDARALTERALEIHTETGEQRQIISCLASLGNIASGVGDFDAARDFMEQARDLSERDGGAKRPAVWLHALGTIAHRTGDHDLAASLLQQALDLGTLQVSETALCEATLANAYLGAGDHDRASPLLAQAIGRREEIENHLNDVGLLDQAAYGYIALGGFERAAELLATSDAKRGALGCPRPTSEVAPFEDAIARLRTELADVGFEDPPGRSRSDPRAASA